MSGDIGCHSFPMTVVEAHLAQGGGPVGEGLNSDVR
jgi:hypothetical protein